MLLSTMQISNKAVKELVQKKGVKMLNSCIKFYYMHNITNYDLCTQTYLAFFNPGGSGVAAVKGIVVLDLR